MSHSQATDKLMVELRDLNKWYGEFHVLKNINLEVRQGEKIVICGPSGSGKSTMIRCINRLAILPLVPLKIISLVKPTYIK